MSNTITLTDEQWATLQSGEAVTISPPPPPKWEPSEAGYRLSISSGIFSADRGSSCTSYGGTRNNKPQAVRAMTRQTQMNRLSAYVDEFEPDNKGFTCGICNYYVYKDINKWRFSYTSNSWRIGEVYMNKQTAEVLVSKLNSGEVVL